MLRRHFPDVQLIESQENLGFARANNLGASHAEGDFLLLLNPDTEIEKETFSGMVSWLRANSQAGAAGPLLRNTDGSVQISCVQAFPTILNQLLDADLFHRWFPRSRLWGARVLWDPECRVREVDAISGACFMIRRNVFQAVGGFAEDFFMYSDDLDLSYRVHEAGYSVVCIPGCEVIHHGGKSSDQQLSGFADIRQRESLERFFLRTRGAAYSKAFRYSMAFAAILRLIPAACALPFVAEPARLRMKQRIQKWRGILGWSFGVQTPASL
jgi:GT2 family glycosyltransferase